MKLKVGEDYWGSAEQRALDVAVCALLTPGKLALQGAIKLSYKSRGTSSIMTVPRVGYGECGQDFELEKIRTGDDPLSEPYSVIARLVREHGLDELGQIANIKRRQMSFWGPRPLLRAEREEVLDNSPADIKDRLIYTWERRPPGIVSSYAIYAHSNMPRQTEMTDYEFQGRLELRDGDHASMADSLSLLRRFVQTPTIDEMLDGIGGERGIRTLDAA